MSQRSTRRTSLPLGRERTTPSKSDSNGDSTPVADKGKRRADLRSVTKIEANIGVEKMAGPSGLSGTTPTRPNSTGSPEPNCAICLGRIENKSFADNCYHSFCLVCLTEWAKVKPECPVCRQGFMKIICNVRSMADYDEQPVQPRYSLAWDPYTPGPDHIRALFARQGSELGQFGGSRFTRRTGADSSSYRIGITIRGPNQPTIETHRIFTRSVQNNPGYSFNVPELNMPVEMQSFPPPIGTSAHRRYIYTYKLWARVEPSSQFSPNRYRKAEPDFFRQNPAAAHRLIAFLSREIVAIVETQNSNTLVSDIIGYLNDHHIRSRSFRRLIEMYTLDNTDHFIHELYCFARSASHDLTSYDRTVNYVPKERAVLFTTDPPVTTPGGILYEDEDISSDASSSSVASVDSSCIEVVDDSDDEPATVIEPGTTSLAEISGSTSRVQHAPPAVSPIDVGTESININIIDDFDNPRPGPSGCSARSTLIDIQCGSGNEVDSEIDVGDYNEAIPRTPTMPQLRREDGYSSDDSIMFVSSKKPIRERTPEIIDLSSDEEEEDKEVLRGIKRKSFEICDSWLQSNELISARPVRPRPSIQEGKPLLRSVVVPSPMFQAALESSPSSSTNSSLETVCPRPTLKSVVRPVLSFNMEDFTDDSD